MWPRFTPYASRALSAAIDTAIRCGKTRISPEHLLAGLIENPDGMCDRVLRNAGIEAERVRTALALFLRPAAEQVPRTELSAEVGRIIRLAYEEAERLRDRRVGTEHLLLGLAREGESVAATVLLGLGGSLEHLRREVGRLRPTEGGVSALARAAGDAPPVSLPDTGHVRHWWRRRLF